MRDLQPAELANNRSLRRSLGNNCCYFYYFDNYRPVFAQKSRKPRNPYPKWTYVYRFAYRDPDKIRPFGLIAEEVEKVNPDLIARDEMGKRQLFTRKRSTRCY